MFSNNFYYYFISFIFIGNVAITNTAYLRCYKGKLDNHIATPLERPLVLLNTTCIDNTLPTVVYTFGYRGRAAGPATSAVLAAYLRTGKRNVLLLDWELEAKSGLLGIPLGYALNAVPNSKKVGEQLGAALVRLAQGGLNMSHVHLVGHSLGAHLLGSAGRAARRAGYLVPRITGLDPARALFEGSLRLQAGLDRRCARFVDVHHTDPGGYGTSLRGGTVDFWPNYAGPGSVQPGCPAGDFEMFSPNDLCSHDRSWQYLVDSISSPGAFPAREAADYSDWLSRANTDSRIIFMGDLTNVNALGNYFLSTNAARPFGRGKRGTVPEAGGRNKRTQPPAQRPVAALTRLLKYLR